MVEPTRPTVEKRANGPAFQDTLQCLEDA